MWLYWLIIQNSVIDNGIKNIEREHWIHKPMHIPHGGQTPSYKYTHTVCNRIHVCSPSGINGEMGIWPNVSVISIPSPLKKCPCTLLSLSGQHQKCIESLSQDTPHFLEGRAHLGTGQCRREGVVTDGYSLFCVVHIHLIKTKRSVTDIWSLKRWISYHLEPFLTAPCANAPITTAAGPSGTKVRGQTASPAEKEVDMRGQPGGRWSDTGFLIILRSLWGPSAALTLSLCSSWTKIEEETKEWFLRRSLGNETNTGEWDWLLCTFDHTKINSTYM